MQRVSRDLHSSSLPLYGIIDLTWKGSGFVGSALRIKPRRKNGPAQMNQCEGCGSTGGCQSVQILYVVYVLSTKIRFQKLVTVGPSLTSLHQLDSNCLIGLRAATLFA